MELLELPDYWREIADRYREQFNDEKITSNPSAIKCYYLNQLEWELARCALDLEISLGKVGGLK